MDYKAVSKERIAKLQPTVAQKAMEALEQAWKEGIPVLVVQGLRTFAEQNELYAQGRTKPGKIVTNAKAGQSPHNFGLAFDICLYVNGKDVWTVNDQWKRFVAIAKSKGFAWGGDWKSFKDYPHFEMLMGKTLAEWRKILPNGYQPGMKSTAPSSDYDPNPNYHRQIGLTDPMMKGEDIKRVQQKLGIQADGVYGPASNAAMQAWKKEHDLNPNNGAIDEVIWNVLFGQFDTADAPNTYHRELKFQNPLLRGNDVKRLQERLKIPVNGWFGTVTRDAVKAFVKGKNLRQDGVVDQSVWYAIFPEDKPVDPKPAEPKPAEPKAPEKPKQEFNLIHVNGKHVATLQDEKMVIDKVVEAVKSELAKDSKLIEIKIERVVV